MNQKELQTIKELEDELMQAQQLEFMIKSTDGREPVQKIINSYSTLSSLYSNPDKMQKMIDEIQESMTKYIEQSGYTGKILGKKAVEKYLLASERKDWSQKALAIIARTNEKQAAKRLNLALMQLEKETGIFKADIKIFMANARLAGYTDKQILGQLVQAAGDKVGIIDGFSKRVKSVTEAAVRREKSAREIEEYEKEALPNEEWVWITISASPCPDCQERAAKILPMSRWEAIGVPGAGRTICGKFCRCKLVPVSIADKKFPTVREFNIDSKKLVLTTASEERILEAKKNQYNYKKE